MLDRRAGGNIGNRRGPLMIRMETMIREENDGRVFSGLP